MLEKAEVLERCVAEKLGLIVLSCSNDDLFWGGVSHGQKVSK